MTTQSDKDRAAYGMHLAPACVREVWAAVTETPQATVREIAERIGLGYSTVATALRVLRDAGYVESMPRETGRRIIVPLVVKVPS